MIQRLRLILTTNSLNDSLKISQINDTFDYFLNKLSSEKQAVRMGSLKILQKLLINEKFQLHLQLQSSSQIQIDLKEIIDSIKSLAAFSIYLQPLMIKHFRRALMVETNSTYLNLYVCFIFEQLIDDYQQKSELESSLQMQIETATESAESTPILIKNSSLKSTFNEIAVDLSSFFFNRPNLLDSIIDSHHNDGKKFFNYFSKFSSILISLNEYSIDDSDTDTTNANMESSNNLSIKTLIRTNQAFDRNSIAKNSYILIEITPSLYVYIHEKIFNLIMYLVFIVIESIDGEQKVNELENLLKMAFFSKFNRNKIMNCSVKNALNDQVKNRIFSLKISMPSLLNQNESENLSMKFARKVLDSLISSFLSGDNSVENCLHESLDYLLKRTGISVLSIYLMLSKMDLVISENASKFDQIINNFCNSTGYPLTYVVDLIELSVKKIKESPLQDIQASNIGQKLLSQLHGLKEKYSVVKPPVSKPSDVLKVGDNYESLFSLKHAYNSNQKVNKLNGLDKQIDNQLTQNDYSVDFLNTIQSQISELKTKYAIQQTESMQVEETQQTVEYNQFDQIITASSNQNLEINLKKHLNTISSTNERVTLIADSLLNLEKNMCSSRFKDSTGIDGDEESNKQQSIIVILLDYFCHLDPQVISADDPKQYQILFESRSRDHSSAMTQPFLLSLFIHQGDWQKLYNCVLYLLSENVNNR